jgi:hypothetical protein
MRGAPPVPRQQQAMSAPVVTTRPITRETPPTERPRSDVSQAFESITGMEEIAEIHSPAPGSAADPPGVHPTAAPSSASEYIHKRGDRSMRDDVRSQRIPVTNERPSQRIPVQDPRNADAPPKRPGSGPIAVPPEARTRPASGAIPVQRSGSDGSRPNVTNSPGRRPSQHPESPAKPPTPPESALPRSGALPPPIPGRSPPPAAATAATRGTPQDNAIPIPRTRTPTAPRPFSASPRQGAPAATPRSRTGSGGGGASGGGVVMSRPAVIVGARSQTPTPAPTPAAGAQGATPPEPPRTSTNSGARVRRAREEGGGRGVFGQDLISEKSLDEVILAYLSEDASEE